VKRSGTISLFGNGPKPAAAKPAAKDQPLPKVSSAPKGVPTIVGFRKLRDGSVTGKVYGSPSFEDGEQLTTSPIASGTVANGNLVQTGSGSRYFLSATKPGGAASKPAGGGFFGKPAAKKATPPPPPPAAAKPTPVKRSPTISLFGNAPKKATPPPPPPKAAPVKKSATFSLFGKPAAAPAPKKNGAAPPGAAADANLPVLKNWVQNPDGSLTGNVSNTKAFRAGTEITTSPVRRGAQAGTVVATSSGSKYKLM
jgi:hypothetical protein